MSTKTKFKRLIAILLAITMVLTDASLSQSLTDVYAASETPDDRYTCLKPHPVTKSSIADWAKDASGYNEIESWNESTATSKTAHIISFNGKYYLPLCVLTHCISTISVQ